MPTPRPWWLNLPNTKHDENERILERNIRDLPTGTTLLQKQVLGVAAATVTFTNIDQKYNHLRVIMQARSDAAAATTIVTLFANNDTGANYTFQGLRGSNITTSAFAGVAGTGGLSATFITGSTATAGYFGFIDCTIYNYTGSFFKLASGLNGLNDGTAANMSIDARIQTWLNTSPITSLLFNLTSGNFIAGSSFYLYGVF